MKFWRAEVREHAGSTLNRARNATKPGASPRFQGVHFGARFGQLRHDRFQRERVVFNLWKAFCFACEEKRPDFDRPGESLENSNGLLGFPEQAADFCDQASVGSRWGFHLAPGSLL